MYNIIADIAGRYNELMALVEKMPKGKIILVGDLVDRGPDSMKVVQWAMTTPDVITLKGNHEQMMIDAYDGDTWDHYSNGARQTLASYGVTNAADYPEHHIEWMRKLPMFFQTDGLFVSHCPWLGLSKLGEVRWEHLQLWNREPPKKREGVFQVFGHNHRFEQYGDWAVCLDNCAKQVLTGMSYPDKKVYEVAYE